MLDRATNTTSAWTTGADLAPAIDLGATLRGALAGLVRQWRLIGLCVAAFLGAGLLYVLAASPQYTASAAIVVDPRAASGTKEVAAPLLLLSDAVIDSEVLVLTSRALTGRVVDRLGLAGNAPADAAQERERARRTLVRALEVARTPDTFVLTLGYTAPDPVFAARVLNTLIEEYVLVQVEANYDNTRRLNEWLSARVDLLADAVAAADAAVEDYRRRNDLYAVRGGVLPANAEYGAANERLVAMREEIAALDAEIDKLREQIDSGSINTVTVSAGGASASLADLQRRHVELTERERERAVRLGDAHALTQEARQSLARSRQLIVEELGKIVDRLITRRGTLELQSEITAGRIEDLSATAAIDAQKSIPLRELEREAASKRRLYETMLERLDETNEQQTFEPSPARVIAEAVPPDTPSAPRTKLVLAFSLLGGLVLGAGLAFLREALDDVVRRAETVTDALGLPLLGLAPVMQSDLSSLRRPAADGARKPRATWLRADETGLTRQGVRMRFCADHPASMFAETLRLLDVRARPAEAGPGVVVGFTSVRKGEGKSTLCGNFAAMQAARGYRVAVLDFDVRAPAFRHAVKRLPEENALERLVADPAALAAVKPVEALGGAVVLTPSSHIVWSDAATLRRTAHLIAALRTRFDYVLVDVPPMSGLVDAGVAAGLADHMVLAIEWGRIRTDRLRRTLQGEEAVRARLLGAVFTKVHPEAYARYNGTAFREYYSY